MTAQHLDLNAIKARCDQAHPGPWTSTNPAEDPDSLTGIVWMRYGNGQVDSLATGDAVGNGAFFECDAEFIANARQDVPALVAEVERLRALLDRAADDHYCPRGYATRNCSPGMEAW